MERLALVVPTEPVSWAQERRFAGISAFGMSGTNVHLIVGEPPEDGLEKAVKAEDVHSDPDNASLNICLFRPKSCRACGSGKALC